jgi:DNA-binding response OmpR family regulator
MFTLSSVQISGRRVLVIEDDIATAAIIAEHAERAGALVAACVSTIEEARHWGGLYGVSHILLDTRHAATSPLGFKQTFRILGVELVFIAGFDDWYDQEDDQEDVCEERVLAYA